MKIVWNEKVSKNERCDYLSIRRKEKCYYWIFGELVLLTSKENEWGRT